MDAQEMIAWIHGARNSGVKYGLNNMRALLDALSRPQEGLRFVHVAGTNGKGSVCAMLESALRSCGLKTGLYTSPYLTRYNERVRLNGRPIDDESLLSVGLRVRRAALLLEERGVRSTPFELGTALAFCAFREAGVDVAVVEVGLGGRLDPTNVITPMACAIANIGMDHMELLGGTLPEIAAEKAGILKPGVPAALYPQESEVEAVFREAARRVGAPLTRAADFPMERYAQDRLGCGFRIKIPGLGEVDARVNLPGAHQAQNARLALCTLALLRSGGLELPRERLISGIAQARWPGRLEWAGERLLLDGAHNPQGAAALCAYLDRFFPDADIVLLTGMMADKQPEQYARILAPRVTCVVAAQADAPRALPAERLAGIYRGLGKSAWAVPKIPDALALARELAGDRLALVAGSLYLVGAIRDLLEL